MPLLCMLADLRQSAVKASHPRIVSTFEVQIYGGFTIWAIILYIFNFIFSIQREDSASRLRMGRDGTAPARTPGVVNHLCVPSGTHAGAKRGSDREGD